MRRLIFTVYGLPVAQARAGRRHFIAGGRACSQTFDPAKSKNWKQDVRLQVLAELRKAGDVPTAHEGPVIMDLFFYLPRPKSLPKRVVHHLKKPDKGNLEKGVEDALKGLIWRDDSQVIDGRVRKQYGDPPRVVIALQLFDATEPEGKYFSMADERRTAHVPHPEALHPV
jgi:Holliday junction resolvase RusA-like endonuclease